MENTPKKMAKTGDENPVNRTSTKLDTNIYEFRNHSISLCRVRLDSDSRTPVFGWLSTVDRGQSGQVSGGVWNTQEEAISSAEDEINQKEDI